MIVAILQARLSSTRLPGKVLKKLNGKPMLQHIVKRLEHVSGIDKIVVATSQDSSDDELETWCNENNISCFRGSLEDVLDRYYQCAKKFEASIVIRVTCDDPFKDSQIIEEMINLYKEEKPSLLTNNNPPTFPEGLDVEIIDFNSLEKASNESTSDFEREHVTQFFYRNPEQFKIVNFKNKKGSNLSHLRFTVDTPEDFDFASTIYRKLDKGDSIFSLEEILKTLKENPDYLKLNSSVKRSHMYEADNG